MKKMLLILIILSLLAEVRASPIIGNFSINPQNLWVGEAPIISLNCYDENHTITWVYSNIVSSYIIFPTLNFTQIGQNYIIDSSRIKSYLDDDTTGIFTVNVYCANDINEVRSETKTFSLSQIIMEVKSILPNPSYIGDTIEINLDVKKDGLPIKSYDVNFQAFLNNQIQTFNPTQPYYDNRNGWILRFNSPSVIGTYNLKILADYSGKSVTYETRINVQEPIQFEIISLDKTEIKPNENITIRVKASNRNNKIELRKDYINLWMDSSEISSENFYISSTSTYDDIILKPPSLSSGSHTLKLRFNYQRIIEETRNIFYVTPVSGKVLNYNDEPIHTEFTFSSGSIVKKIVNEKNGSYYGFMYPGTYDLEIKFPESTVDLSGLNMDENDFNNIISYNYFGSLDVFGIRSAGLFFYDISPEFSDGSIQMSYDQKSVSNEDKLSVYRCDNWDSVDKDCNNDWKKVDFEIDKKNDLVKVDASSPSTYVIGNEKSLFLDISIDKKQYYSNDIITIDGIVQDDIGNSIPDANVNVKIQGTNINASAKSSRNGIISIKMSAPDKEKNYSVSITVEKYPYINFNRTAEIEVLRKIDFSILAPETVRVKKGENSTIEVSVVNIGQVDLSNMNLFIDGIPKEYYNFNQKINSLTVGDEEKVTINFLVPENASEGTFSGKFRVEYDGKFKEEVFGFTTLPKSDEKEQTQNVSKPLSTTGKFVLPNISLPNLDFLYIIPVALISFVGAYVLKKNKKREPKEENDEIGKMFSEIKFQIRGKSQKKDHNNH